MAADELKFPANAFEPAIVEAVATQLRLEWDASGALARDEVLDGLAPNAYFHEHSLAICAIAAAGGSQAEVLRYLRVEEETRLGSAVTSGHTRGAIAKYLWQIMGHP